MQVLHPYQKNQKQATTNIVKISNKSFEFVVETSTTAIGKIVQQVIQQLNKGSNSTPNTNLAHTDGGPIASQPKWGKHSEINNYHTYATFNQNRNSIWITDSKVNHHMMFDKNDITCLKFHDYNQQVFVANGSKVKISGVRNRFFVNKSQSEVLYILSLRVKLLSVSDITKH